MIRTRTLDPLIKRPRGRQFFANPGPTNIPDSVLRAIDHVSVDFFDDAFLEVYDACYAGLKRILKTDGHLFLYGASGHGAWEATLSNLLSPGDTILMLESGYFSEAWGELARSHRLEVRLVAADWRRGVDVAEITAGLKADRNHTIAAVCCVHNETATGIALPLPEIREAIDAAQHPALFLVDTISSLASIDFRMDEWRIDATVGGSQKGLMLPTAISFTAVSQKAMAAHAKAQLPRHYFDWTRMLARRHRSFIGTVPTSIFYGMRESLRLLEEEGLEAVFFRHHRLAEAVRSAVRVWSINAGPQIFCLDPTRVSDSVTSVLMPDGYDAEIVRRIALERFNVSLGGGLSRLDGKVFRIGHMGDLNEPMVLGTLAAIEMSLRLANVPHGAGALDAAMDYLARTASNS